MAKSNLKNVNNYMFWKLPNYSYNFKQSNSIFFHYFFCLYIVVINFFYNTIINKNYVLYKRLYYNVYINNCACLHIFKKLNILKFIPYYPFIFPTIRSKNFFLFKSTLVKKKIIKPNSIVSSKINKSIYNKFFTTILRLNNINYSNKSTSNLHSNTYWTVIPNFLKYSNKKVFNYNCFYYLSSDTNMYTFVLKFFYISSKLYIILYFNKSSTYLILFNKLVKDNKITSSYINIDNIYSNIKNFKNKFYPKHLNVKINKNIYKHYV